ncbi:Mannan polymerase complex subunit mnn9 [Phytophthora cinnamomi]|uniref:Mannan polymerase complex subunit mnn9 n=1 Tax=Phytophthora cinnamomi TaxID=4785 RepID=UPI0035594DC1|nr:Mannan polymerase complex subunit mnn9 [Phytophthora cinnamomi]
MKQPAPNTPEPPVTSVLHPITPPQDPLNPNVVFRIKSTKTQFDEYEESFPQYGKIEPGRHYRIENTPLLSKLGNRESNSVLIICVFNDAGSWGGNRTVNDFFNLVGSFNYPKEKISISMLTSSLNEFGKVRALFANNIQHYPRLSVMFRNDFVQNGLSRDNRHEGPRQADRRRMIARYRNYVLMSSLETWHQGVLWLDADVEIIPSHLLPKMVHSGLDILMPTCYTRYHGVWINYDQNGWIGQRAVRPADLGDGEFFMPGPLNVKLLDEVEDKSKPFTPMDSVGGTMLYVRAEVHRQGVVFPMHYVIGSEWGREGYDGIETEGLCYAAHFLGFKCWGMVNESIQHTEEF